MTLLGCTAGDGPSDPDRAAASSASPTSTPSRRSPDAGATASASAGRTAEEEPSVGGGPSAGASADDGRPGPATTGVDTSADLETVDRLVVKEAGAVIEDLHVRGSIDIKADDVTIRNTLVTFSGSSFAVRTYDGYSGTVLDRVTIVMEQQRNGTAPNAGVSGGTRTTVRDSEITGVGDGIKATEGSVYTGNWIHLSRPEGSDKHLDAIQGGASDLVIRGNFLDVPASRGGNAGYINTTFSEDPPENILIEGNWINGGNYALFVGRTKNGDHMRDVRVIGNTFGGTSRYGSILHDGDPDIEIRDNVEQP